jgi:NAD(P)H-dependent flavin oxidoreductase YrpB (nitropropane dioxygenase family)
LHDVQTVDTTCELLGKRVDTPIITMRRDQTDSSHVCLLDADAFLASRDSDEPTPHNSGNPINPVIIPALAPLKMGELMPKVRKLVATNPPALALDLTKLAHTPPYGEHTWHPRTREDIAELQAAVGVPLWLYGIASVADAEIASEAGVAAIVVHSGSGIYLGAPATADIFPDIVDAVAGTVAIHAGGWLDSGVDVFRYLALGAEAVVVQSDRTLLSLQRELIYAMRLTGCATLADIGYEAIFAPLFEEP